MTKTDKIGTALRKFDYLWSKKGGRFCDIVKYIYTNENFESISDLDISDDELIERLKDIDVNIKEK